MSRAMPSGLACPRAPPPEVVAVAAAARARTDAATPQRDAGRARTVSIRGRPSGTRVSEPARRCQSRSFRSGTAAIKSSGTHATNCVCRRGERDVGVPRRTRLHRERGRRRIATTIARGRTGRAHGADACDGPGDPRRPGPAGEAERCRDGARGDEDGAADSLAPRWGRQGGRLPRSANWFSRGRSSLELEETQRPSRASGPSRAGRGVRR